MRVFPLFSSKETGNVAAANYNPTNKMEYPNSSLCNAAAAETDSQQPERINIFWPAYWQQLDKQMQSGSDNLTLKHNTQFVMHTHNHDPEQHLPVNSDQLQKLIDEDSVTNLPCSTKKAFHNAVERHRRNKLKVLYSELRSLLPNPNPKRKLSIPNTVGRVLKYIPELRNQIEELGRKRAELLTATKRICNNSAVTSKSCTGASEQEFMNEFKHSPQETLSSPINVTVNSSLGSSELLITILACKTGFSFSTLLLVLEKEGLDLLNASTFLSQHGICHNLHLRMRSAEVESSNIIGTGRSEMNTNLEKKLVTILCEKSLHPQVTGQTETRDPVLAKMESNM